MIKSEYLERKILKKIKLGDKIFSIFCFVWWILSKINKKYEKSKLFESIILEINDRIVNLNKIYQKFMYHKLTIEYYEYFKNVGNKMV